MSNPITIKNSIITNENVPLLAQQQQQHQQQQQQQQQYQQQQCNNNNTIKKLKLSRDLMYVSHLFAKGSDIVWQFCLVLFLAAFTNYENLILVSTFNLFSGLVVCFTGGYIGNFIDKNERLFTAHIFIWIQNISVLAATFFCYLLLNNDNDNGDRSKDMLMLHFGTNGRLKGVPTSLYGIALLVGIHIFGALANVLDQGITVAIEKDWVVVMSKSCDLAKMNDWLSETNITMTQIDLSCKSLAPALAGYLLAMYGNNLKGAALFIGVLNISCLIVQWVCSLYIYKLIPDLSIKLDSTTSNSEYYASFTQRERAPSIIDEEEITLVTHGYYTLVKHHPVLKVEETTNENKYQYLIDSIIPEGWKIYMNQSTAWSGLALAFLYFNILTFGAIMTAYLVWRGMSLESIGVWRGVSAAIGLLGTFAFRISISKLSLAQTGLWSVIFQFICLSLSYISLFIHDNYTLSVSMLIGGVCASRVGLWVFDITMKQFFQECVDEEYRGIVGGLQNSLQAFFGLMVYVLGIIFPNPSDFYILVATGYVSVGIALFLYWIGFYRRM